MRNRMRKENCRTLLIQCVHMFVSLRFLAILTCARLVWKFTPTIFCSSTQRACRWQKEGRTFQQTLSHTFFSIVCNDNDRRFENRSANVEIKIQRHEFHFSEMSFLARVMWKFGNKVFHGTSKVSLFVEMLWIKIFCLTTNI